MKKLLVTVIVLLIGSQAFAAEKLKIGFVDLQAALNESEFGRKTKNELEEVIRDKRAVIDEKIKEKDAMQAELDRQSTTLSDEAMRQRVDELQKLEREIERKISDANEELQKLQREKEMGILKDLDDIISRLGKEEGYVVILPSDVILYSAEGVDLTDRVIVEYNKLKGKETGKNKK